MAQRVPIVAFGWAAAQKYANLVDLKKMLPSKLSLTKIGFDTVESEHCKVIISYFDIPQISKSKYNI